MHTNTVHRLIASAATASLALSVLVLPQAASAAGTATYELRPHCQSEELDSQFGGPLPDLDELAKLTEGRCSAFTVRDPESMQTLPLNQGDELDLDLIIKNPSRDDIARFRAWIAYDPTVLEGTEITVSNAYPIPTPGENVFDASGGVIKVSGTTMEPLNDSEIRVARIRLRALAPKYQGSPLTFQDYTGMTDSKTGIYEQEAAAETNVMGSDQGYVYVRFNGATGTATSSVATNTTMNTGGASSMATTTAASSIASAMTSTGSSSARPAAAPSTVFTMLQVQGVRVTTEGSSVFLAWDALPSTELVGYNIYYGTTTGKYIQRRGVEKDATTLTLRALPNGTTYYFAIRAVNDKNQETEFSQEVGVSVGNPSTSTAPLTANSLPTRTPSTNGSVAGETGVSSMLLPLLMISAVIGTFVAFRRQQSVRI